MDFQSYTEVVLPSEKGAGVRRGKKNPGAEKKQSLSAPKEYRRSAD